MEPGDYGPWKVAGFDVRVDVSQGVRLVAERDGQRVEGLPEAVRRSEEMAWIRLLLEAAAHTRRMLKGLLERAMVEAIPLEAADFALLCQDPVGRSLLEGLLVECGGLTGRPLLDEAGIETLQGDRPGLAAPLQVAHPVTLWLDGTLPAWQTWLGRLWLRQPFKQIRREIAFPDTHDRKNETFTARFAGEVVRWDQARALLEGRDWYRVTKMSAERKFRRAGVTAFLEFGAAGPGRHGRDAVALERLFFLPAGELPASRARPGMPLADVPPVLFSEAVRDAGLVAQVAGREYRERGPW